MRYEHKNVLIIGYGESGKAAESFLKKEGASTFVYDDRLALSPREKDVAYDFAVVSPAVSKSHKLLSSLREKGIPILSEIDLAFLNCKSKKIIAVSGTNGKTSVCTILGSMLSKVGKTYVLGNIGVPFISKVGKIGKNDFVVIEISSFQIEQSEIFFAECAALTNVGEDHLDRHHDKNNYQKIKLSLLTRAHKTVVNADDPIQSNYKGGVRYSASGKESNFRLCGREIECSAGRFHLPIESRGASYDADFLCAFSVACTVSGVDPRFLDCYGSVELPPFRNEFVGEYFGAKVYNDSKGTNVDATLFACSAVSDSAALILGGSDKGEDYARLAAGLPDRIKRIYLTGGNATDIYTALSCKEREICFLMTDLEACVRHFANDPLPILLFSPASASFDRYSGYKERGEVFNALLEKYGSCSEKR